MRVKELIESKSHYMSHRLIDESSSALQSTKIQCKCLFLYHFANIPVFLQVLFHLLEFELKSSLIFHTRLTVYSTVVTTGLSLSVSPCRHQDHETVLLLIS